MFEKVVVIDCKGHLMGRLGSIVAKELLNGQNIVLVRCEDLNISGSLFRNKLKFDAYLVKRMNTNPKRGPLHHRAPARLLWKVIRGMLPHYQPRGEAALARLKLFEGVPDAYAKYPRKVIPQALRVLRLKPGRDYCRLGDLSSQVGWKHDKLIGTLEQKRLVAAKEFYEKKKQLAKLKEQAAKNLAGKLGPIDQQLTTFGF